MQCLFRTIASLLVTLLWMAGCTQPPPAADAPSPDPILVLVSFDGWRWDYASRATLPNLQALAARGVSAEALVPVFPPKTFPNHYTIVTGLYPEHHGIVGNTMEDAAIGERFTLSAATARDRRWWAGEPLWTTVERNGKRSGSMFWPGSEVPIGGHQPTWWFPYDDAFPNVRRVQQVLDWLALPDGERPDFITLYFSDVDTAGHEYGPESREVIAAAERLDAMLGELVSGIQKLGLLERTVVAVVSDHGMAQLSPDRVIFVDDYLDPATVKVVDWSPVLMLAPPPGAVDRVYRALEGRHPAMAIYKREETPPALHYRSHLRISPIVGIAADGWTITSRARFEADRGAGRELERGAHGYDPANQSMHGLFVAAGPRLREGMRVPPFENVHLYELFCALLGVDAAANDGDPAATRMLLAN